MKIRELISELIKYNLDSEVAFLDNENKKRDILETTESESERIVWIDEVKY